jgi:Xaa-Pro aminopeptidase
MKSEFLERVEKVKGYAASKGFGSVVVFSSPRANIWNQTGHVSYISNWSDRDRLCDTMVVIPLQGEPVLLLSGLPYMAQKAREISWMKDIRLVGSPDRNAPVLPSCSGSFGSEVKRILQDRRLEHKKIGIIGIESMPVPVYQDLIEFLSVESVEIADDIVAELRSRKSPIEIQHMQEAARLSDIGFSAILEAAKPGMRGYEVVAEMERAVRSLGADFVQFWMSSTPADSLYIGAIDIKPHQRKLQEGDQITCCSYIVYNGYWAHSMRTGRLGGRSSLQERIFSSCLEVHRRVIEAMKPGVCISEVAKTARSSAEKAGLKLQGSRIGHGIGLDYGETPAMNDTSKGVLEEGMVVVLHVQFNIPETDSFHIPLGDVCHITRNGVELLTKFPQELFCAG